MSPAALPDTWEQRLLELINASRAVVGAGPLSFEPELQAAADKHTHWMLETDIFSHTGAGGSSPFQRMGEEGYDYRSAAENIAYISGSSAAVLDEADVVQLHNNLMNSPGHQANLLNANYTEVGLGLEQGDYGGHAAVFVTEEFGQPSASEAAEPDNWFI
jgi:uncharacterized protein YkwD